MSVATVSEKPTSLFRGRIDCDNGLGTLFALARDDEAFIFLENPRSEVISHGQNETESKVSQFTDMNVKNDSNSADLLRWKTVCCELCGFGASKVWSIFDALPIEVATRARDFTQRIPFAGTGQLPMLSDDSNPPHEGVCRMLVYLKEIGVRQLPYYNGTPDQWLDAAATWRWEYYCANSGIYRAHPTSVADFLNCPIFTLMVELNKRISAMLPTWLVETPSNDTVPTGTPKRRFQMLYVLQRIGHRRGIPSHVDFHPDKVLAFMYYLTPDDWNADADGGFLSVAHSSDKDAVNLHPTFNRLIVWTIDKDHSPTSPIHSVRPVLAGDDRPRLCLVGFLLEIK